jgi:hypothetical protein
MKSAGSHGSVSLLFVMKKLMPDDILPDEFMTGVRCINYKSVCSLILLLSSLVMSPPVGQE